jgi:hypothetical protein
MCVNHGINDVHADDDDFEYAHLLREAISPVEEADWKEFQFRHCS